MAEKRPNKLLKKSTASLNIKQRLLKRTKPLSRCTAKFISQFDVTVAGDKYPPTIWSSAFLPDSRLLLPDVSNEKLKMFDTNFKFLEAKQFQKIPWCVSVFDNSEVAVLADDGTITRLFIGDNITEKGTLSLGFKSYSIAYVSNDTIAATSARSYPKAFFCLFSTSGDELSRISTDAVGNMLFCAPFRIAVDRGRSRAYVSDSGNRTVYFLDLNDSNKCLSDYQHKDLVFPKGVTVDTESNIYVCGEDSHNIHQVSPDGEHIKILMSKNNGLHSPTTIAFSPSCDVFVVGSDDSEFVKVFTME